METMVWVHDTDLVLFLIMTILVPYGSVVRRAFQGHEMYCHNLESWVQTLVGLNLWCVVLLSRTRTKNISTTTPAKNKLMSIFNISVTITAGAKDMCQTYHKTLFVELSLSDFRLVSPLEVHHLHFACNTETKQWGWAWVLCCLRTPGSVTAIVIYDHTLFLCLRIIRSDLRPHL